MQKWVVKHYRLTIGLLFLLGIALIALLNLELFFGTEAFTGGTAVRLILEVLLAIFLAWAVTYLVRSVYLNQCIRKMNDACDPDPFIEAMDLMFPRFTNGNFGKLTAINHAEALHLKGDSAGALAAHRAIAVDQKMPALYRAVYYNNLTAFLLADENKDLSGALAARAEFERILAEEKLNEQAKRSMISISAINRSALLLEQGATEEAEAILMNMDLTGMPLLTQVTRMMGLAEVSRKRGEDERAAYQLKFVIEKCNKMPVVKEAETYLKEIEEKRLSAADNTADEEEGEDE